MLYQKRNSDICHAQLRILNSSNVYDIVQVNTSFVCKKYAPDFAFKSSKCFTRISYPTHRFSILAANMYICFKRSCCCKNIGFSRLGSIWNHFLTTNIFVGEVSLHFQRMDAHPFNYRISHYSVLSYVTGIAYLVHLKKAITVFSYYNIFWWTTIGCCQMLRGPFFLRVNLAWRFAIRFSYQVASTGENKVFQLSSSGHINIGIGIQIIVLAIIKKSCLILSIFFKWAKNFLSSSPTLCPCHVPS